MLAKLIAGFFLVPVLVMIAVAGSSFSSMAWVVCMITVVWIAFM